MRIKNWLTVLLCLLGCPAVNATSVADIFNTDKVEYGGINTPFGKFVTRSEGEWGKSTGSNIYYLDPDSGQFQLAAFSNANFDDSDPNYDPTQHRLCFVSNRPMNEHADSRNDDIWCTTKHQGEWQPPYRLDAPVNSTAREFSPAFDHTGRLYFASNREGGLGQGDIYQADYSDESGWKVINLGAAINSEFGEWNVGINPGSNLMLIESSSRPTNLSIPGDLYFSQKLDNNRWSKTIPLSRLNSKTSDLMPRWLESDTLMYASGISGNMDHRVVKQADWIPINPSVAVVSRSRGEVVLLHPTTLRETQRIELGIGPHEIAASLDGRVAIAPLFGIFPTPHEKPIHQRPPFIVKPSQGLSVTDLLAGSSENWPLKDCPRPHGIDTDAQAEKIWVTCEEHGSIIQLSRNDKSLTHRFTLDKGVHKVLYLPNTDALLATNPDNGKIYHISLKDKQIRNLEVGPGAEGLIANTPGNLAWIANSGDGSVCRLEVSTMTLAWCQKAVGTMPIALAYSAHHNELWVSLFGQQAIAILDATNGAKISQFALPQGALDLEFNPDESLIYASIPRLNAMLAIDLESRKIVARFDDVMEADDLDYLPSYLSR